MQRTLINSLRNMGGNQSIEQTSDNQKAADVKTPIELGIPLLGGLAAGAIIGSFLTNEPATAALIAGNGAAGAAVGMLIGSMATDSEYAPLAGAIAVPSLIGGSVDAVSVGVGLAVYGGYQLTSKQIPPK